MDHDITTAAGIGGPQFASFDSMSGVNDDMRKEPALAAFRATVGNRQVIGR